MIQIKNFLGDVILEVQGANLRNADLFGANLKGADLEGANLRGADLNDADLEGANLRGTTLSDVDLEGANLRGTTLSDVDLEGADLNDVDLEGAKGIREFQAGNFNRVCYAVKHEDCIMFKLGCFWGNSEEAKETIREKYGANSTYEKLIDIYTEDLQDENN